MKSWYLIQSKPQQEETARENLERQGYSTYLPLAPTYRRRRGKSIKTIAPMFPRYLFIHLSDKTDDWRPIRSTLGVANLVRFGMTPACVPETLIERLKSLENEEGIQVLPGKDVKVGDNVRVQEGPFEGYEAIIHAKSARSRVILLLKVIEKYVKIELDSSSLEILS